MHSKFLCAIVLAGCLLIAHPAISHADPVIDRVVASVNDTAITLSEFQERLRAVRSTMPSASPEEVINGMINGMLMLEKARQMRLEGKTGDDLIAEYVNIKIRAAVLIRDDEIDRYIQQHESELGKQSGSAIRARVEELLTEKEVNRMLEEHIRDLREGAAISIQLEATK